MEGCEYWEVGLTVGHFRTLPTIEEGEVTFNVHRNIIQT